MRSDLCIASQFRVPSFEFRVRTNSKPETRNPKLPLEFSRGDLLDHIRFDLIADLDVVEVLEADTTLESFADFRCVVLKAPQRSDIAFPTDDAVANQTRACFATDEAIDHHAACHRADFRDAEDFAHIGLAEN